MSEGAKDLEVLGVSVENRLNPGTSGFAAISLRQFFLQSSAVLSGREHIPFLLSTDY
jgi:hypothetical protein